MERIIVAVDDSVASFAAARYAFVLARELNATIRILTAVAGAEQAAEGRHLVEHVGRDAHAAGLPPERVESVVRTGTAFECILQEARDWRAELIVMAIARRSDVRSPYIGSQTEHVLEFAECPVLVVPQA